MFLTWFLFLLNSRTCPFLSLLWLLHKTNVPFDKESIHSFSRISCPHPKMWIMWITRCITHFRHFPLLFPCGYLFHKIHCPVSAALDTIKHLYIMHNILLSFLLLSNYNYSTTPNNRVNKSLKTGHSLL